MNERLKEDFTRPIIRLTRQELTGPHVDDLLKRQMSLRGEPGQSRGTRRWYYRNWFVFLCVGTLAALAAWAIVEPYFDDYLYVQGSIEAISTTDPMPGSLVEGAQQLRVRCAGHGWVSIRGQKIWLMDDLGDLATRKPADLDSLRRGQTIGIYVDYLQLGWQNLAVGCYLQTAPPARPPAKALLSLDRLATRSRAGGLLLFPLVAGLVGLAIGAVDGLVCRTVRRALLSGAVGLAAGFVGGFVSSMLASLIYTPLNRLAMDEISQTVDSFSTLGFVIQMGGRALAWCFAGMAMGLGQGIALRSKRLLLYGLLGGVIGGLLGGLLFDPIDLLLLGPGRASAHWSRLIGLGLIGACVGAMIGIVELLARDVWLRMIEGPLAGKEFLIFRDSMKIGSSPRCDIYLFNDDLVAGQHATFRVMGDACELENHDKARPVLVNDRPITVARLHHGDRMTIGRTVFVFEQRQG